VFSNYNSIFVNLN